ncbi:epimerase [Dactylosporangium sp. NBC_01737]|uniref:NAD-dependent epimerase/dehydratase family protein n=1 Tax=Dactylosporangium sp. NBC_01737 TaxID=2975959 RepID=UPI002E1276D4|nr:epimerase [Dactylosporangium sp. NBC_01737]
MRIVVFGATGMVGKGVLRECLLAGDVTEVLVVGRSATGQQHPKLREVTHADFTDFTGVDLTGYDACFFCLGVSSVGMSEEAYRRITFDYTLAAARAVSPGSTFVYVSGAGTGTTRRAKWAQVKGATEDALLAMDLRAYMFRPGFIQPMHGAVSKVRLFRVIYTVLRPVSAALVRFAPGIATTTQQIGRAMLRVAREGGTKHVLESRDIAAL